MNNPNFKITFIQLMMVGIAIMLYISISDGISLCMPEPSELPVPNGGPIISLPTYLMGFVLSLCIGYMIGVYNQPPIDPLPTVMPPME